MDLNLTNKVAIITGASRGIGREIARTLAAEGMQHALVARSQDLLEELAASLPTSLYVLLANAERAAAGIQGQPEVSLFLQAELSRDEGMTLARDLSRRKDLAKVRFVDKETGLRSLEGGGIGDLTAGLAENPLPHAVVLTPKASDPEALDKLIAELGEYWVIPLQEDNLSAQTSCATEENPINFSN